VGLLAQLAACAGDADDDSSPPADDATETPAPKPEAVYVAHDVVKDAQGTITQQGTLIGIDVATGDPIGTAIGDIETPYGMQSLEDGTVLVNLSNRNEILIFDGRTMTELSRLPSSGMGGTKPVDSLLSPEHDGRSYWVTLNDGANTSESNTALFIDVNPASGDYLKPVGEIRLGIGHHQAAFSATRERIAISNFSDCDNIVSVYDYSDPGDIRTLETLSATEAGYDSSTKEKTCDATESEGVSIKPHGCATSLASGKVYCNTTTSGKLIVIDIDAEKPTFQLLQMSGTGGGYVKAGEGGDYVYTVQSTPREGNGGSSCQIGQLVTIDSSTDSIASTVPMFYEGPDCARALSDTDESASQPNHLKLSLDGELLFVALAPAFGASGAHVRQEVVYDLRDPANPVQLDSIPVGSSAAQRGTAITGNGTYHYVTNLDDGTVTEIDVATLTVTRTLPTAANPRMVSTFGTREGPSLPVGPIH
jgi:YVTN family beta-propeller protein